MYNRYIRNDTGQYQRVPVQDPPPEHGPGPSPPPPPPPGGKGILSGILEKFHLQDMDKGDLLLLFILFLLFKEGEDEELLIALALLLIL